MPVVVMRASDLGITGYENREDLDADAALKARLESIRLRAGPRMNLGDVEEKSVPKMTLAAAPGPAAPSPRGRSSRTAATPRSGCSAR